VISQSCFVYLIGFGPFDLPILPAISPWASEAEEDRRKRFAIEEARRQQDRVTVRQLMVDSSLNTL